MAFFLDLSCVSCLSQAITRSIVPASMTERHLLNDGLDIFEFIVTINQADTERIRRAVCLGTWKETVPRH
jgi:hypothetical protein